MKLYFVCSTVGLKERLRQEGVIAVCWSWEVQDALRNAGVDYVAADSLLSVNDRSDIDAHGLQVARSWYQVGAEDFTVYHGLSLGNLCEFEVQFPVLLLTKWLGCIVRLIERFRPTVILHDLPDRSELLALIALVAASRSIPVERAATLQAANAPVAFDRFAYGTYARRLTGLAFLAALAQLTMYGLRPKAIRVPSSLSSAYKSSEGVRRLAYWGSRLLLVLMRLGRIRAPSRVPHVLILSNHHVESILEAWLSRPIPPFRLLIDLNAPPSPSTLMRLGLARPEYVELLMFRDGSVDNGTLLRVKEHWDRLRKTEDYRRRFAFLGVEYFDLLHPYLDRLVRNRQPSLAASLETCTRLFKHKRVDLVLIPYDAPAYHRLLVQVAKAHGIPSFVVQHGVYALTHWDDDRKQADYLAVWGEFYKKQYSMEGLASDHIFVTGAPGMDSHREARRKVVSNESPPDNSRLPRLLVLTTNPPLGSAFANFTYSESFFMTVLETLEALRSPARITVKVHPAEDPEKYRALLAARMMEGTVIRDADLGTLVADHDLVVASSTGAALESWAIGKPTVCYDPAATPLAPPFDGGSGLAMVRNGTGLRKILEEWFAFPYALVAEGARGPEAARPFIGLLDGQAGDRVLQAVTTICSSHNAWRSEPHVRKL